ncbi:WW domain-containing oxidoreductase [Cadophora sp. MPI-SDFR-AT-0126]|nr:WW domain-containing oxidoreductase [Leotiomycetes sp. MPI-SDFR-AT-0126]
MAERYLEAHKIENWRGPGDARPTALQIIEDYERKGAMTDKVFIVTGASSGIGTETGRALAATGGKVFLTVRNLKKGEEACKSFLEPGRVELLEMDNNSLASVRKAAKEILSKSDRLNVLVNNAGIMAAPFAETEDGFESQFGTNHLAHFLFFNLLKDILIASSTSDFHSRVVNVSSLGHLECDVFRGDYNFDKEEYTPWKSYGQSKTANIHMANEIENRYGSQGLHGLSLHPGGIWTNLQRHLSTEQIDQWKSTPGVDNMMKSEEQGAATSVLAAVGEDFEGVGRIYLADCAIELPKAEAKEGQYGYAPWAFNKESEAKLWDDSLRMVGLEA